MNIEQEIFGDGQENVQEDEEGLDMDWLKTATINEIENRVRLIDNEYRVLREENNRLKHQHRALEERVAENKEKIKLNNQLPYVCRARYLMVCAEAHSYFPLLTRDVRSLVCQVLGWKHCRGAGQR